MPIDEPDRTGVLTEVTIGLATAVLGLVSRCGLPFLGPMLEGGLERFHCRFRGVVRLYEIADVALIGQAWQFESHQLLDNRRQLRCVQVPVVTPTLVIVRDDANPSTAEVLLEALGPLARAHGVAGGDDADVQGGL